MFGRLKTALKGDRFVPTTKFFPDLDTSQLIRELDPKGKGIQRGKSELPASSSRTLDHVELEIVAAIEQHRQECLQAFNEHCDIYRRRLENISSLRTEIESAATKAPSEFKSYCQEFESEMQDPTDKLQGNVRTRSSFQRKHRLTRFPHHYWSGGVRWLALVILLILIESILNGYLFAQKNELGLLGGAFAAALVSVANVGASSILGFYSRFINHRRVFAKFYGLVLLAGWGMFIFVFNFGVAHFRDGMVQNLTWNQAAELAVERIQTSMLSVASIESWLLITIGFLISVAALLKAYYADDPYPGYGNIQRQVENSRNLYVGEHSETLKELESRRNEIVDDLQVAEEETRRHATNSVDALFGRTSLTKQISSHLGHCESVAQQLLQIYRDSNEESRTTPVPDYFRDRFELPQIDLDVSSKASKDSATVEVDKLSALISRAVTETNATYESAIMNFPSARKLEEKLSEEGRATS